MPNLFRALPSPTRPPAAPRPVHGPLLHCAACLSLLLAVGCATVDRRPFEAFAQTAQELQTNAGKALQASPAAARERFINDAVANPALVQQLRIRFVVASPFVWDSSDAPLFLDAERFRVGVQRVTGVFSDYARLLLRLASPELLPQASFDQLATDLNANAFDAVMAISGSAAGNAAPSSVGLISGAATAIFQAYLENKKKGKLVDALTENQPSVDEYAKLLVSAVELAANHAWNEYQLQAEGEFDNAIDVEGNERRTVIERLIQLDRDHLARLEILGALRDSFSSLPDAHVALLEATKNPERGLGAIISAMEGANRLEALFDRSVAANQASAARSLAEEAAVRAATAEARADATAATATRARAEATRARVEADAAPEDAAKQAAAAQLETAATQAEEVAARVQTAAGEANGR